MYAIIEEGGGQRKVTEGQEVLIDLIQGGEAKAGDTITFDRVLATGDGEGKVSIGQPYVSGASVTAEVVEPQAMGDKLYIFKFKPKKGYRRKTGHRQRYTHVKITSVKG
ncbi:MAG: 50S ribosomal protein L21 [Phycisphaera sp.]|nr:MAG: 50S ribosomal protein L21 [Phycisphaera sp.]